MISKIHFVKLKNAEHLLFMQQISALLTEVNHEKINPLHIEFQSVVEKEEDGNKQIRVSEHTQKISQLDKERDDLYSALNFRLEAEERCPVVERKEAAKVLRIIFKNYGNPIKLNLIEETSVINNLVAELKEEKHKNLVKLTGLEEWISFLETANKEFFTLYEHRRDDTAGKITINLKSVRKEADTLFKKITNRITALVELEPSEELNNLVSKINATIEKYKIIA